MKVLYFDVETTGLDPAKAAVVQLSGLVEIDYVVRDAFNLRMRPHEGAHIDGEALRVTGLSRDQVYGYSDPRLVYAQFIDILKKHVDRFNPLDKFYPAAYNGHFDYEFLGNFFRHCGDKYFGSWVNHRLLDPLPVLRMLDYMGVLQLDNYKLSTVARHFGVEINAHDAFSDVKALRLIVHRLRRFFMDKLSPVDMKYEFKNGLLRFEDGTEYSLSEAIFLSKDRSLTEEDLIAIHLVKKMFGEITGATIGGQRYRIHPDYRDELSSKPASTDEGHDYLDDLLEDVQR